MKNLTNNARILIALAALTSLILIGLQFRPILVNHSANQSGAAMSSKADSAPGGIPAGGPYPYPPAEVVPTVDLARVCAKAGEWTTYEHPTAGFSFQYPSEARIDEHNEEFSDTMFSFLLKPECYPGARCWPTGIFIQVLDNPNNLSLREFVEQHLDPNAGGPYAVDPRELDANIHSTKIGGEPALLANGTVTFEQPRFYVLHNGRVIVIGIERRSKGQWLNTAEPPCETARELFDKLRASVKFQ